MPGRGPPESIEVRMSGVQLKGSALVLMLYDVCEEIRLEELRRILGAQPAERSPSFKHPAPEYVRFERPPVVEPLERITLETGEQLEGRLKYYDYGVVCVEFELPFEGGWDMLVDLSCRYIAAPEVERHALQIARRLHGPAAAIWVVLIGVHVLVYLKRALASSSEDVRSATRREVQGATWRSYALAAALIIGLVAGIAAIPAQHRWVDLHHHDHRDATPLTTKTSGQLERR